MELSRTTSGNRNTAGKSVKKERNTLNKKKQLYVCKINNKSLKKSIWLFSEQTRSVTDLCIKLYLGM